jgi:hypothetical protein
VVPAARKHALNAVQGLLSFETYKQFNIIQILKNENGENNINQAQVMYDVPLSPT